MKRPIVFLLISLITALMCIPVVSAKEAEPVPYQTYMYWEKDGEREAIEIRAVYEVFGKFNGPSLGTDHFSMPSDIDCDQQGNLYILDSDHSRILVVNPNLSLIKTINAPVYGNETVTFAGAAGIFLKKDGTILIADTNGQRILVLDPNGNLKQIIGLPDSSVIPENFNYAPIKVLTDSRDYIYVLSSGSYYGALVYSDSGEFLGFYGANTVQTGVLGAVEKIWNRLTQTEAKRANSVQKLPYQFVSMDIDEKDFIYTLTGLTDSIWTVGAGQLRRLNPAGHNILTDKNGRQSDTLNFADDLHFLNDSGHPILTNFNKLCVDDDGFIYAVDTTYGHIFVYDMMCNSFAVFGGGFGAGDQIGTFIRPESVAVSGDRLYVLDSLDASVTVFRLTEYGKLYHEAQKLTLQGKYAESADLWKQVLKEDRNNLLAYRGLSKNALMSEDYDSALSYSKLGFDQTDYAVAFEQKRSDFISANIWWMLIVSVALIAVIVWRLLRRSAKEQPVRQGNISFALSSVTHPFQTFYNLKHKGQGSVWIALLILLLFYVSRVLRDIYSGFSFKIFEASKYNSLETLLGSVGIAVLFVIVNWGGCV
ncbi:MAG: NHL repeat-containing protein, partial [Clostridia bacterium]|nr:NHL repeat-containing protein [Clostridia bacterium]